MRNPLASRGISVEVPSAETLARLAAAGIKVQPARVVDLTLAGTRYDSMKAALDILSTAPEFDLLLCVVGSSARFYPELAVKPIIDSAEHQFLTVAGEPRPLAAGVELSAYRIVQEALTNVIKHAGRATATGSAPRRRRLREPSCGRRRPG